MKACFDKSRAHVLYVSILPLICPLPDPTIKRHISNPPHFVHVSTFYRTTPDGRARAYREATGELREQHRPALDNARPEAGGPTRSVPRVAHKLAQHIFNATAKNQGNMDPRSGRIHNSFSRPRRSQSQVGPIRSGRVNSYASGTLRSWIAVPALTEHDKSVIADLPRLYVSPYRINMYIVSELPLGMS